MIIKKSQEQVQNIIDSYVPQEQKIVGTRGHIIADWLWNQPAGVYRFPFDSLCFQSTDVDVLLPVTKEQREKDFGLDINVRFFAMNTPYITIYDQQGDRVSIKNIYNDTDTSEYIAEVIKTPLDMLLQQIIQESFIVDDFAKKSLGVGQETISGIYINKRSLAGEGVQAKFLQAVLESMGGKTYDQNDRNVNGVESDTRHFVMRDLLIGMLYGKGKYIETDTRITSFAMIPMKLLNNTFVSKDHHDSLKALIDNHITESCEEIALEVDALQSILWINDRGGNHLIRPCVSFVCGAQGKHDGISIKYIDGSGVEYIMPPVILGTTNRTKSLGWSKYLDCICDYVVVGEGKNKIESLFAGIETISIIDGVFEPKQHKDANPHYMIDNILVEQGLLYTKMPETFKKKTRDNKGAIRKKFLELRAVLLDAVYNNPYFTESGSDLLHISMQNLIARQEGGNFL